MKRQTKWIIAGAMVIGAAVGGASIAVGAAGGNPGFVTTTDDSGTQPEGPDTPITGSALDQAKAAALAHTGGGRVTETEVGDEESLYEVEVTLDNGTQVDVQLDEKFKVVGWSSDGAGDDK